MSDYIEAGEDLRHSYEKVCKLSFLAIGKSFLSFFTYDLSVEQCSMINILWLNIFRVLVNNSMYMSRHLSYILER